MTQRFRRIKLVYIGGCLLIIEIIAFAFGVALNPATFALFLATLLTAFVGFLEWLPAVEVSEQSLIVHSSLKSLGGSVDWTTIDKIQYVRFRGTRGISALAYDMFFFEVRTSDFSRVRLWRYGYSRHGRKAIFRAVQQHVSLTDIQVDSSTRDIIESLAGSELSQGNS